MTKRFAIVDERPKSGRKPGRQKGSRNKLTKDSDRRIRALGQTLPLEYMLKVMNDPKAAKDRRDNMARAAAPYCHSRLAAITLKGDPTQPVRLVAATMTMAEAAEAYALMRNNPRALIVDQTAKAAEEAAVDVVQQIDEEEEEFED